MAKKKIHHAGTQNQVSRRSLLSLPVVAGGILLLNEPIASADVITPEIIKENTSTGDALALYTNLLPEVRSHELNRTLERIDQEKAVVAGTLHEMVELWKSMDSKYREASTPNGTQVLADLRRVTGRTTEVERVADVLDDARKKVAFLREFDSRVGSIHSMLLDAADNFAKAKRPTTAERAKLRSAGMVKLDTAINNLKELLNREVNEATLDSPLERLIVLLLGVRVAVEKEGTVQHHASFGGIMEVLKANIKPGSWIQMGVGYAVAFPVLIRNQDRGIREKLLMDGLRLVPGLVPSPLVQTAQQLSVLSL